VSLLLLLLIIIAIQSNTCYSSYSTCVLVVICWCYGQSNHSTAVCEASSCMEPPYNGHLGYINSCYIQKL